jgi:hypothetical protein
MAGSNSPSIAEAYSCFYVLPYVDEARDDVIPVEGYPNECLLVLSSLYGYRLYVRAAFVSNVLIALIAAVRSSYGSPRSVVR